jgi:hypothetical protein
VNTAPGADEHRIRRALHARGVAYTPQPVPAPTRPRDWLDDYLDGTTAQTQTRPPDPPGPPDKPATATDAGEPRWDWRRLRTWPYARLTTGAAIALIPWYGGQSAGTAWGHALSQCREQASVGGAWVLAAVSLTIGAVWVHRRHSWPAWAALTSAFVGTIAMGSPLDIVTFITGVTS